MTLIKIVNIDIESVQKGKSSYEMMEVLYDVGGQKRTQKIVSFANPASFAALKKATKGDLFEVEITKNDQGYNQFASAKPSDGSGASTNDAGPPSSNRSVPQNTGARTFETAEERESRQRLIVRQSCLSNAISTLSPGSKGPLDPAAVKATAEDYVDWVFEKLDLFDQPNDLPE